MKRRTPEHPIPLSESSREFELLAARHSVPHAGSAQRVHVLHDDKRSLLQSYDGQVVLALLRSRVQVEARPHVVPHRQRTSLPLADLCERTGRGPCDTPAGCNGYIEGPRDAQKGTKTSDGHIRESGNSPGPIADHCLRE